MKKFNDMKIQSKLVFSFFIAVIIPLFIVGFFLTQELRTKALNDAIEQSSANIERVKNRTAETLESAIYIANNLTLDQHLKNIVNTEYSSGVEILRAYREYSEFRSSLQTFDEISNIRLYVENPTMLDNWEFRPTTDAIRNTFWYQSALETNGLNGWFFIPDETKNNRKYLSLVRSINYPDYKSSSVLVININTENLNTILNQEQSPIMIIDDNNYVVVSNRKDFVGKKLNDIIETDQKLVEVNGTVTGKVNGEQSEILVDLLLPNTSQNELKFVSVIPNQVIMADANRFVQLGFIVICASFVIALILIYMFSRLISKRIILISDQINTVAEGNLDAQIKVEGTDEIGKLSKQLNYMVQNLQDLIARLESMHVEKNILQKRQQEIKLKMLASQINPHFLFNALESIRMKAHLRGEKDISSVVKQLGKLMRKSIEVTGELILLKNEIETVELYLKIQQFRYEDRLTYELDIDPLSEGIYIHPLIIQPLVENAVIHGLEFKEKGGKVTVKTCVTNHQLYVSVMDNGVGISEEKQQAILKTFNDIENSQENRIGLMNVHQRLKITFGENSGLNLKSELGKGTCISFSIPIRGNENV
ncbi:cache domain-containing sensor histidine kinase [Lederbergia graminis]|uniref:histidine kinase n=1 Tax=Lederbergia graminis TaxID=735518 RepID=A0ABW0LHA8_9BACI